MRITIELDAAALVRWRTRAGHMEDGTFVVDDPDGQATGPYGKVHAKRADGSTACGRTIPAYAEAAPDQASLCGQCASKATYTLLAAQFRKCPGLY
jgi:hypothetical protein